MQILLFFFLCTNNLLWQLRKSKKENSKEKLPVAEIFITQGVPFVLYWGVLVQQNDAGRGGREWESVREMRRGWPWSSLMQSVQGLNANQTEAFPHAYSSAHTSCQPLQWYTHTATCTHITEPDPRTLLYSVNNSNRLLLLYSWCEHTLNNIACLHILTFYKQTNEYVTIPPVWGLDWSSVIAAAEALEADVLNDHLKGKSHSAE